MRSFKYLTFLFLAFIYSSNLLSQNLTKQEMLEFYPDNIGNSWFYTWVYYNPISDFSEGGQDRIFIFKDTLINNSKYFLVQYIYGGFEYENYFERIDTATGNVIRIDVISKGEASIVDNVYAEIGDTISISNNRYLLYCDKIVIKSLRDTVINNFHTTIREVIGLPTNSKLYFARNIGMLGTGKNGWIDSANVNGTKFSNITDVKLDNKTIENKYALSQNYPNPFNPTTKINYTIAKTSIVTIKVYNVLGKEITTLVNAEKSPGNYSINFTADDLSSGIYFYRMQAGSFIETKKFILLK